MVRSASLLLILVSLVFGLACGSDSQAGPAPRATEAPTSTPTGPYILVEPRSGPPGTSVTVRGSGWVPAERIDVTGMLAPGSEAAPYDSVTADEAGRFTVRFRLEETPEGADLRTGRFDLIARSASGEASAPFLVETRRPITGDGPGG